MKNETIRNIYLTGTVVGRTGNTIKVHSAVDPEEGEFLFNLVRSDPSIENTLEVGCAYGLSALHICEATRDRIGAAHTIIDPFQNSQWDGAGMRNLEASGIAFATLIESRSEFALPRLLEQGEGRFDFIFVDGWHTFDHTLVDCFYATRLLRVGGYLVIDDVTFPSVRRVVDFLRTYPCYEEHGSVGSAPPMTWKRGSARVMRMLMYPVPRTTWSRVLSARWYRGIFDDSAIRMVALKKTSEDERNWDWHDHVI